jgi:protein SCO1/2
VRTRLHLSILLICLLPDLQRAAPATSMPAPLREAGIDQRLGERVSPDLRFRDESGREVVLGDYFRRKPVVLALVYYECPMLCTAVLNGLLRSLRALSLSVGEEFDVLTVSFDPREGPELAAAKKSEYVRRYQRPRAGDGWHFLTGSAESIRRLTDAVGFRYTYDQKTEQFVHASAILVMTPEGRTARYLYGIEYSARDLRLALVEASQSRIGSPVDQVLLYCFHYEPSQGKYGLVIMNVIRLLGTATVAALACFMLLMFRRDRLGKTAVRHDPLGRTP